MPEPVTELTLVPPNSAVDEYKKEGTAAQGDQANSVSEQERTSDGPVSQPEGTAQSRPLEDAVRRKLGLVPALSLILFYVTVGTVIALFSETSRSFIFRYWWGFALAYLAFLIFVVIAHIRGNLRESLPSVRAGVFIFVVLPALLITLGSVILLPRAYQVMALRGGFLAVVCFLPALMWYLFLATRKASLLNEFLTNLRRLGLLDNSYREDDNSKKLRIQSYLQKFEAIYGDLTECTHVQVLAGRFGGFSRNAAARTVSLSTATFPVALSTVLIAIGWMITLPLSELFSDNSTWVQAIKPTSAPVALAFLGAYFFSLQMLFRRYVLKDLGGTAYVAVSIRVILAVIGIWTLMVIGGESGFSETQLLVAGFVLGVFPRVIWQIIESLFKRVAGFAVPSMTSELPVSDLDGLTVWHEARLQEEDIENIPNMANADLVELFLNTQFPSERIIDWADQAILYTQLGPQGDEPEKGARYKLRMHGIRTATSLLQASAEKKLRKTLDKILEDDNGVSALPTLEASLIIDSNLKLIQRWRSMSMSSTGAVSPQSATLPSLAEAA